MKIIRLAEVTSTNNYAKELGEVEDVTVVIADVQTGGKGTKGRSFVSPLGGLYMSIILRPNEERLAVLTPIAAVAVRRAVKEFFNLECGIKWVNDLYLDGKKVCGILVENKFSEVTTSVIGIGLNVYRPDGGYGEYEDIAGSITEGYDKTILEKIAVAVTDNILALMRGGEWLAEYSAASILTGKMVILSHDGGEEKVFIKGIDECARLIIIGADGQERRIIDGDIVWRSKLTR